jgi:hypothetical protein
MPNPAMAGQKLAWPEAGVTTVQAVAFFDRRSFSEVGSEGLAYLLY